MKETEQLEGTWQLGMSVDYLHLFWQESQTINILKRIFSEIL